MLAVTEALISSFIAAFLGKFATPLTLYSALWCTPSGVSVARPRTVVLDPGRSASHWSAFSAPDLKRRCGSHPGDWKYTSSSSSAIRERRASPGVAIGQVRGPGTIRVHPRTLSLTSFKTLSSYPLQQQRYCTSPHSRPYYVHQFCFSKPASKQLMHFAGWMFLFSLRMSDHLLKG